MPRAKRPPTKLEWAQQCREVRDLLGISQRAMAQRLHIHERTYQSWEAGEKMPNEMGRRVVLNLRRQAPKAADQVAKRLAAEGEQ